MRILIICTGNSCRSQMAHGILQSFDRNLEVHSAGTNPGSEVNTRAVEVMSEAGIDISGHFPKSVELYKEDEWDYVITVCNEARESCPVFTGKVKHRLHFEYIDPSFLPGSEEYIMSEFRKLRETMKRDFYKLYTDKIKPELPLTDGQES